MSFKVRDNSQLDVGQFKAGLQTGFITNLHRIHELWSKVVKSCTQIHGKIPTEKAEILSQKKKLGFSELVIIYNVI